MHPQPASRGERKGAGFHGDQSPGSQEGASAGGLFPPLLPREHTALSRALRPLAPLQPEPPEPQVEAERSPGWRSALKIPDGQGRRYTGHRGLGHSVGGRSAVTLGWPCADFKALPRLPPTLFHFINLHHASRHTASYYEPYSMGITSLFMAEERTC